MKRIFKVFLLFLVLFSLVGCGERLETPANVKIVDDVLSWNQVQKATGYVVKVDENEHSTSTTSFNLLNLTLAEGTYQVSVKAVGNEEVKDSRYSNTLIYVVGHKTLSAPTNLAITDGVLTWNQVSGAIQYKVTVNGSEVFTEELIVDVADYVIAIGQYPVTVVAIGNGVNTFDSEAAQTTLNFNQALLTLKTSHMINVFLSLEGWEVGMGEGDFQNPYEYERYLNKLEEFQGMVDVFVNSQITVNTVKKVFVVVEEIIEMEDPVEIMQTLIQSIDSFGITSDQLANFVLFVNKIFIEKQIESFEHMKDYLDEYLILLEEQCDQALLDYEEFDTALQNFLENADPELNDYISLMDLYVDTILSYFYQITLSDYEYYIFNHIIEFAEKVTHSQYLLEKELAKGEGADQWTIQMYQDEISYYSSEIEYQYWISDIYRGILEDCVSDVRNQFYLMLECKDMHPDIYFDDVYLFYSSAAQMEMRFILAQQNYNEASLNLENQKADYDEFIQQLELMLVAYEHENTKELIKMGIEQMLVLFDEINWDLFVAFIETLDDEEAPSPAFLAEVVQEVARLLRIATDYEQEEYVDLALEVLLSVLPDISEDVQLTIRTLAAQTLPAMADIVITVIEKIDEDVIETIFTLTTMDPDDDSKIEEKIDNYFNPDFIILLAQLYDEVLADAVVSLIEELETVYEMAGQFYPEMPEFDLEGLKNAIASINEDISEIAGFEIISEGYYPTEQIDKILEVMEAIENLSSFFDTPAEDPEEPEFE